MSGADFDLKDVSIVLAEERDHPAVLDIFREGVREGQLRENDTGADIENLFEGYFSDDGASAFWVARLGASVIGMVGVQRTSENTAEICRLRVRERYRRHGVGSMLLEEATNFCRRHGYLKVVLDVRIDRGPAIAMFKNFGFTLARTREIDQRKVLDFFLDLYSDPKA